MAENAPKKKKGRVENLIPFNKLTEEQQREIASRGGKASADSKKKKKDMREQVREFLASEVPVEQKTLRTVMKNMGISPESWDYSMAIISMMVKEAAKGNVRAAAFLRDTAGFMPDQNVNINAEVEEKPRVMVYLPEIEKDDEEEDEDEEEEGEGKNG